MSTAADFNVSAEDTQRGRFLAFLVGSELYGIEIKYVTEIIGIQKITEMPEMPGYMKGIINLRGNIIPLIDVRLRFSMPEKAYDDRTCVIVIGVGGYSYGLIVDSVNEVMTIDDENISALPGIGASTGTGFVKSIGKTPNGIVLIADCEKLLTDDFLSAIADIGA